MTKANILTLIINIIVGWFAAALFAGATLAPALIVALIIAALIWIIRVLIPSEGGEQRKDILYAVLGLAAGVIVPLLVPQLSLDNIGADALVQTFALFVFVQQA